MAEVLYAPDPEQVRTTNAWAFLHWLGAAHGIHLPDWGALQRWSACDPIRFSAAFAGFAGPAPPGQTALLRAMSDALLFADLRPDDRVLVVGPTLPWRAAVRQSTKILPASAGDPLERAAAEQASILVIPAGQLAGLAFQRRQRPALAALRSIITTGGPLAPTARRRIYTWVKPDLMLLGYSGNTYWGNPLEPVLARPPATPALFTPPIATPAPR